MKIIYNITQKYIEHTVNIYNSIGLKLSVSGSFEFIKNKILNWIDDNIISIRNKK